MAKLNDRVFDTPLPPEVWKPFYCSLCRELVGYFWSAEYDTPQDEYVHPKCFEKLEADNGEVKRV